MGLFEKKFCDICGEKVNTLTQQKLSDGYLCSDCKHKLGSFTSGWKQRNISDVKAHLEQREQNKAKYQQFNCSATAGGRDNTLQVDFNSRKFIFAIDNRDYKSGNPQVFDFNQLQDFWLEQEFRTVSDSDNDGIPDSMDNFDNRGMNNSSFNNAFNTMGGFANNMQNSMVNVPLAAQPFIKNTTNYSSSSTIREVTGIKACFRVNDQYITEPICFSVSGYITSGNQMELMNAYDMGVQVMQLCQQIKQGTAQQTNNQGFGAGQTFGQQQTMNNGYQQPMQQGYAQQQPMNQGYQQQAQQPAQNANWFCPNCGAQNSGQFCASCGTQKPM